MPVFKLEHDSLQDRFLHSTAKIQLFGGGFANGKTSAACVKALQYAKDYPGSNGLMARSTYPKLNDTLRKEFLKWCPENWIKSFPKSANASNTCTLNNGTTINFRYIAQQGKSTGEATTSNLLSATYDWIVVDQIEDPEIVHKDFLDLLGRLRGMAPYVGDNPDMPASGPRHFIITSNPTRNWVYRKLVKPLFDYEKGIFNPDLMCETDNEGRPDFDENGKPTPIIELFEGSTYENRGNLEEDFIKTLEASYKGQMRDRFLLGNWAAYEGLVYPSFSEDYHVISEEVVRNYLMQCQMTTQQLTWVEGYDYGLAVPACYLCGFVDPHGNVILVDGWYEKELDNIEDHALKVKEVRARYGVPPNNHIWSDPDIFRRKAVKGKLVGQSIAGLLGDEGLYCASGNNNIDNGIIKVSGYLTLREHHANPFTGEFGAPYLYLSDKLDFVIEEINGYYWKRDSVGDVQQKPIDKNDHAMDVIKYILSKRPPISKLIKAARPKQVGWYGWGERDLPAEHRDVRHG